MNVLLCDDDPVVRATIRRVLEGYFGFGVRECGNGAEALEMLKTDSYGFMFLDLNMPVMDGLETLKELRQSPGMQNFPVIILSAENDPGIVQNVMKVGITEYVLKPLHTHTVIAKVEKVVHLVSGRSSKSSGARPSKNRPT